MFKVGDKVFDDIGNELHPGCILRMFHFETTKKRYYMYKKFVGTTEYNCLKFLHLDTVDNKEFRLTKEYFSKNAPSVVVQCTCEYHIHNDLKRSKKWRD